MEVASVLYCLPLHGGSALKCQKLVSRTIPVDNIHSSDSENIFVFDTMFSKGINTANLTLGPPEELIRPCM